MSVLRTNEDTFEDQANANNYVTDQNYKFSIPSKGSSSYFPILPKNHAVSQIIEDTVVHTLSADDSEDGILQVFKADGFDNISGMKVIGRAYHSSTEQEIMIDDCEYADDDTLKAAWTILDDNDCEYINLYSTDDVVNFGNYAIQIRTASNAEGNYIKKAFAQSQDWSDITNVCFYWYSEKYGSYYTWKIVLTDNIGQECYYTFNAENRYSWEQKSFAIDLFNNSDVVDFSAITDIRFECETSWSTYNCYLDDFKITVNTENRKVNAEVSLYHLGTNPDFSTIGDLQTLDDEFPSEDILLELNTKRITPCAMNFGSLKNSRKLVQDDYYGIFISKPDAGSIELYGSSTQMFAPGNLYHVDNGQLSPLDTSLGFMICTFSESTLRKIVFKQDIYSPGSTIQLLIVNPADFSIVKFLGCYTFDNSEEIQIEYDYSAPETINLTFDQHLYAYYQDDYKSTTNSLIIDARFHYSDLIGN